MGEAIQEGQGRESSTFLSLCRGAEEGEQDPGFGEGVVAWQGCGSGGAGVIVLAASGLALGRDVPAP